MRKLELKHLAPYLPYCLNMHNIHNGNTFELKGIYDEGDFSIRNLIYVFKGERSHFDLLKVNFKPLLIPLTEENITEEDLKATSCGSRLRLRNMLWVNGAYHFQFEYMVSRHFDVFRLIDAGLALNKLEVLATTDK